MLARLSIPVDIRKRDTEACHLTPSMPAGRCVGVLWVAPIAMSDVSPFVWIQLAGPYREFP